MIKVLTIAAAIAGAQLAYDHSPAMLTGMRAAPHGSWVCEYASVTGPIEVVNGPCPNFKWRTAQGATLSECVYRTKGVNGVTVSIVIYDCDKAREVSK